MEGGPGRFSGDPMSRLTLVSAAVAAILFALPACAEEAAKPAPASAPADSADVKPSDEPVDLTPEEKAEKEARKACKVQICAAFRNKKAEGGDISCGVVKSWRKEQLTKLVAKLKVTWPYGPVRCTTSVNIKRTDLIRAMTEDKVDTQLDKHSVACTVDREKEASTELTFDFSPKVTWEKGKATSAQMNWGKLEAPTLLKSALWTATAADNTINILSGTLAEDINNFIAKKCDEVKDEIAGK
jgi:hypothetical protein